jgi:hypothetical protein
MDKIDELRKQREELQQRLNKRRGGMTLFVPFCALVFS